MTTAGQLTAAHLEQTHALRDEWMRIGLSTDRCDRPAAEAAVHAAYDAADLTRPSLTIWMDSPLGGVYAKAVLRQLASGGQLWGQLGDQLRGQLWGQLGDQLRDQLRGQLGGQLRDQLRGQLWGQLGGQLDPWCDAYWLTLYDRALDIAGIDRSRRLDTVAAAVRRAGRWWPMRGCVVLTDRPAVLHRDQQGRLHADAGPALAYTDGYDLHAWHGIRVPVDLVQGDGWAPDRILRERNAEIRRCAIERRGWDRFVHDANLAQVGPAEPDPGNPGQELRLYDLPASLADLYEEPARILVCSNASLDRDGTRRTFGLPVPADVQDPISAAAATFDLGRDEYAGLARAT